jgi:hypothetical protein
MGRDPHDLHDVAIKLRAPVDRIERRLAKDAQENDFERRREISEIAHDTPQGHRYGAVWRKFSVADAQCWKLVDRLITMRPRTGPGLAEVIFACSWDGAAYAEAGIAIDTAAALEAAAVAGGFELPRQMREAARAEVERVAGIEMDRDAIFRGDA